MGNGPFFATGGSKNGESKVVDLLLVSTTKIVRHVKTRAEANSYARNWQEYFPGDYPGSILESSPLNPIGNGTTGFL